MSLPIQAAVAVLCLASIAMAQIAPSAPRDSAPKPESGFVSAEQYTNAFFGFSLPLPPAAQLHEISMPSPGSRHFLFGAQSQVEGLTILTVTAVPSLSVSSDRARDEVPKAASAPPGASTKSVQIGGKEFSESESQEQGQAGNMRTLRYTTVLNGYLLEFALSSFNPKLTEQLQHGIESVKFFDPEKAQEIAGPGSRPYLLAPVVPPSPAATPIGQLSLGVVSGQTYTNEALGFDFRFPPGWVVADETTQIEPDHLAAWAYGRDGEKQYEAAMRCTRTLLWVTKYPEGTKTKEFNPLIAIMATDPGCIKGFKFPSSIDDKKSIKKATHKLAGSFAGAPYIANDQSSVSASVVQGHLMVNILGSSSWTEAEQPRASATYFTFTEIKGYLVAWQIVSGSLASMREINVMLLFSAPGDTKAAEDPSGKKVP